MDIDFNKLTKSIERAEIIKKEEQKKEAKIKKLVKKAKTRR